MTPTGSGAPAAIATWRWGLVATAAGGPVLAGGGGALDAVEAGINAVELDPEVPTVGFGGLPNAAGEVEVDALIMRGSGLEVGAVAAVRGIATPISLARRVMDRSRHAFLVGDGALAFALDTGFEPRDLLTEPSRERWEAWLRDPEQRVRPAHDTVGMVALDASGSMAAGCSTSGLPFKEPGRVGDSPLVGAGAYCDDRAGGAAATGDGDAMLRFCLSFAAVESMSEGLSPADACKAALRRMVDAGVEAEAAVIALDPEGHFGAAVIGRESFNYAVWAPGLDELRQVQRRA